MSSVWGQEITALEQELNGIALLQGNRTGQTAEVCVCTDSGTELGNISFPPFFMPSFLFLVAMYREPSLHDVGETVPKAGVTPSKSTSASAIMNGGKPVNKSKTT